MSGVWERGYRAHGLWVGSTRIGVVGLAPFMPGRRTAYYWSADGKSGERKSLRAAKRAVEIALERRAGRSKASAMPASKGSP